MASKKLLAAAHRVRRVTKTRFWIEEEPNATVAYATGVDQVRVPPDLAKTHKFDELVWIVAHEVAHLEMAHSIAHKEFVDRESRKVGKKVRHTMERSGSLLGAIAGGLVVGVAAVTATRMKFAHTRQAHEYEADDRACAMTAAAGFDPTAGARALFRFHHGSLPSRRLRDDFFGSHPDTRDRIRRIEQGRWRDRPSS